MDDPPCGSTDRFAFNAWGGQNVGGALDRTGKKRINSVGRRRERRRGHESMNAVIMLLQISADGNTTTSVLSFMATKADADRHLSCQAENRIMGTAPIEDGWLLQIQCKRDHRVQRLLVSPLLIATLPPPPSWSISTVYRGMLIRRHAGDADTARHVAESERDTRGHRRLL